MDISGLNKMQMTGKYFETHFPEEYDVISRLQPEKFQEKLYWHIHNLTDYPACPICGKRTVFENITKGYRTYCSKKCCNSDPNKIERTQQTCIERYGAIAPACIPKVRRKAKQTCIERYGTEYAMQTKEIQEKSYQALFDKYGVRSVGAISGSKEKAKQTCIERYGGVGFASDQLNKSSKQTCIERYGDANYNNTPQLVATQRRIYGGVGNESSILRKKYSNTIRKKIVDNNEFLAGYTDDGLWICKCPHPGCTKCVERTYAVTANMYFDRKRDHTEPCTNLLKPQRSHSAGTTIELFIRDFLNEHNVQYETNKGIFEGKHADIWIPDLNIAIECNGVFHHSTHCCSKSAHINKMLIARKMGIQLIYLWWDEIITKPEIVKSIIANKLGLCDNSIAARKCVVKKINSKIASKFLNENHIQGAGNATHRLGLYYGADLVSVMTFNNTSGKWVLNRFCNKLNTRVIGGAGKLFKYALNTFSINECVSYSSNDISDGNLYKVLGFVSDGKINDAYFYIKGTKRYSRDYGRKSSIVARGEAPNRPNWTEEEAMREAKYLRIHTSGTMTWVYKKGGSK